ncbi:MAG: Gfo/Idh/MocA family oxidoreductase [bacterium]|nr:Gfo/Idh/MocA family oxidoreductase [bacterium]
MTEQRFLRWGIIGAGDIVRKRVAPAIRDLPNCELTAIARANADRAEEFAREFGAKRWYANWRGLLGDAEIDAVYIATPVYLHAPQTIAAAEAGKHVLCEKPMAMSAAECDTMIAACAANGVKLGIAYYRRFYPVLSRVRELITSGELGRPVAAQINSFEYVDIAPDDPRHWFLEKAKNGGGPMMDFGCHRLEVLANLFGTVRRMSSLTANIEWKDREVEDTAVATLEFDAGPIATVTVTHGALEPQDTLDIFFTSGSIHIPVLNRGDIRIVSKSGEKNESLPAAANTDEPLIADFTEAVLNDRGPTVGGETGREIARLIDEIYRD